MNMKFLAVVTPPPYIYRGWSTWETLWEKKFTPVKMTSCGSRNVSKHREIKNGEQYIILNISYNLDCMYKREFKSSESKGYMVRPGKGLTNSLAHRNKRSNNKQKVRFAITDINNQEFKKFLKNFNNSTYLGY